MRSFVGFVLGVVLTIFAVFVHDRLVIEPPAKPWVNWDVVQESVRGAADAVYAQWERWTK